MSAEDGDEDRADGLVSRLAVIEAQALEDRAPAYLQLHDELRSRLSGAAPE